MTLPNSIPTFFSSWSSSLKSFLRKEFSQKIGWICFGAWIMFFLSFKSMFRGPYDLGYDLIAVSWGSKRSNDQLNYQAQVYIDNPGEPPLEIKARICIGGGSYQHSLGTIGWADSRTQAIQSYGNIEWNDTHVLIGGTNGVRAQLSRKSLEQHR
jgi:hypothetical protein